MIQAHVSGNWHTLLTQLLLTSLLPHSISVKDNRLESASVIRWCRWMQVVSEVEFQGVCHEPDDRQMAAKRLHQSLWWGIPASIFRFEIQLMGARLLWQNFIVLAHFIVWIKWGCWGSTRNRCNKRKKCQFLKITHRKWVCYQKKCFPWRVI